MKITQDIRDYAASGMTQKAAEFRDQGGELYVSKVSGSTDVIPEKYPNVEGN